MVDTYQWTDNPFAASDIKAHEVHVIGCGTTGTAMIDTLIAADISRVYVWDDDIVEPHNIKPQLYGLADRGASKVGATRRRMLVEYGQDLIVPHRQRFGARDTASGIVVSMVDDIPSRVDIWEALQFNADVQLYVDGRLGPDGGTIIALDPCDGRHVNLYEQALKIDTSNIPPVCGKSPLARALAQRVACEAMMRIVRWVHKNQGCTDPYANLVSFRYVPKDETRVEYW